MFLVATVGPWQIAIVALVVILLFGVGKLSGLGRDLGSSIKEFRRAMKEEDQEEGEQAEQAPQAQIAEPPAQQPAPQQSQQAPPPAQQAPPPSGNGAAGPTNAEGESQAPAEEGSRPNVF